LALRQGTESAHQVPQHLARGRDALRVDHLGDRLGLFSEIAFVQRVNTWGGVAPTTGCDASTVNTLIRVPYSADYYFYVSINQG
jgi:hypothetical protein